MSRKSLVARPRTDPLFRLFGRRDREDGLPSTFGDLLKSHRRTADLTQERLAELASYSVDYVKKLETGTRRPTVQTVEALATAMDLNEDALKGLLIARLQFVTPPTRTLNPPAHIIATPTEFTAPNSAEAPRIFISYAQDVEPDESLARELAADLDGRVKVFLERGTTGGADWTRRVEDELSQSDILLLLLSETSVVDEMVLAEVQRAFELAPARDGLPRVQPVRVAYEGSISNPLKTYIGAAQWVTWRNSTDTSRIIDALALTTPCKETRGAESLSMASRVALESAVQAGPEQAPLRVPGGAIEARSNFYVARSSDARANRALDQQGVTIVIKGPRQVGKSSMLIQILDKARHLGRSIICLDFQLLNSVVLSDADAFFPYFCAWIAEESGIEISVDEFWSSPMGNNQRCTRFVERGLLPKLTGSVVLALDEVDRALDTSFYSDFFGMLRGWHGRRALHPDWRRIDLALVTSTEPYQLMQDLSNSPFNVGEIIELADFSPDETEQINATYTSAIDKPELARLFGLLNGHPYLTSRAIYLVATSACPIDEILATASDDLGPFGDHLRHHLFRLRDQPDLKAGLLGVIRENRCRDETIFFRLRGAGLVRRDGARVLPRCEVYAQYFAEQLGA